MSKILVHFPVLLAFLVAAVLAWWAVKENYWIFIVTWQALSAMVMLILDGKNREKRFKKILFLVKAGKEINSLPRDNTICGFFIRKAVQWESRPEKPVKNNGGSL